jgi:hypothetical protein
MLWILDISGEKYPEPYKKKTVICMLHLDVYQEHKYISIFIRKS